MHSKLPAALALLGLTLAGCASLNPGARINEASDLTQQRLGQRPVISATRVGVHSGWT